MQEDVGLQAATDGEFRRTSWHMDFIYQLGGIDPGDDKRHACSSTTRRATSSSRPPALHVDGTDRPLGDDLRRRLHVPARHRHDGRAEADDPVAEHGPLPRRPSGDRRGRLPRPRRASGPTSPPPTARRCAASASSAARTSSSTTRASPTSTTRPARATSRSIGGDPEHQHVEYIRHINEALAGPPEGMAVTTHMCRGNFRSSWVAEGGYDFVAEALFNELEVDGFFMECDDERSGGFEPLRFVPQGKQVVLGLVTTKRGELETQGRPQAADRGGQPVRAARPALPLAPVRLLLDRRGQRAHLRRAGREARGWSSRSPRRSGAASREVIDFGQCIHFQR